MGLINPQSVDIVENYIQRCIEVSPQVERCYFNEEYRAAIESTDAVTPELIADHLNYILLNELQTFGIILPDASDRQAVFQSYYTARVIPFLRERFDAVNLFNLLTRLKQTVGEAYHTLRSMYEMSSADDAGLFSDFVAYLADVFTFDTGWERANEFSERFASTLRFYDLLTVAFNRIEATGEVPVVQPNQFDRIKVYLDGIQTRTDRRSQYLKILIDEGFIRDPIGEAADVIAAADLPLSTPDALRIFVLDYPDESTIAKRRAYRARVGAASLLAPAYYQFRKITEPDVFQQAYLAIGLFVPSDAEHKPDQQLKAAETALTQAGIVPTVTARIVDALNILYAATIAAPSE